MKRSLLAVFVVAAAAGSASAIDNDFCTAFELPLYTPGPLVDQDSWFNPVAGSVDFNVVAYDATVAANPTGEFNYVRGTAGSTTAFARAQHGLVFNGAAQYTLGYDVNVQPHGGQPPALNNIGSFSLQNSTTARFTQSLFVWNDLAAPTAWNAQVVNIDAAGANLGFVSPGADFNNLSLNHWYRQVLTIDFVTNEVLSMSITDLATSETATVALSGIYLGGGANNVLGLPMPDAARLFVGGDPNNTVLFDNVCLEVIPAPATGMLALLGLGAATRRRRH